MGERAVRDLSCCAAARARAWAKTTQVKTGAAEPTADRLLRHAEHLPRLCLGKPENRAGLDRSPLGQAHR
jgi:hypothetical protein